MADTQAAQIAAHRQQLLAGNREACQQLADSDDMVLEGYAAVFNSETDLGHFREVIKPGAFDDVMTNDVRALINHDPNLILGRTENGTLELSTDERGLKYRVKLGNQQYAKDFYESVKRGDISQSSFAFTIKDQSWNEERTVRSVDKVRQAWLGKAP